jgi:hypothetical protein
MRVDLPTWGGPTTATTIGAGLSGVRSGNGTWCFFSCLSAQREERKKREGEGEGGRDERKCEIERRRERAKVQRGAR